MEWVAKNFEIRDFTKIKGFSGMLTKGDVKSVQIYNKRMVKNALARFKMGNCRLATLSLAPNVKRFMVSL